MSRWPGPRDGAGASGDAPRSGSGRARFDQEQTISEDRSPNVGTEPPQRSSPSPRPLGASDERTEELEGALAGQGAPPVVAVVVACDPGRWFTETVESLAAQDYPQMSILVVDNASASDPAESVAEVAPGAFVKRRTVDEGFSVAANEAVASIEGALPVAVPRRRVPRARRRDPARGGGVPFQRRDRGSEDP
ncbi:MAG: glycosyltransferase [Microthrixaceae bacterium]